MRSSFPDGTLVDSLQASHPVRTSSARGFTLLEAQVALLIFVVAASALISYGRAYKQLVGTVESQSRFDGVALPDTERVVMTVTNASQETPPCELRLETIDAEPGGMQAEVVVTRRLP
jgi:hypothetical protein